jgi:Zn-finger nucleic acid-binding protein
MRSYERNQVHVDQCTGCGGLFLDRGELEALVAAETAWHQPAPPQAQQPQYPQQPQYQQRTQQYGGQHYGYGHPHKKRKSFLSELFDD